MSEETEAFTGLEGEDAIKLDDITRESIKKMEQEMEDLLLGSFGKLTYKISVDGCDDSTFFNMELTKNEFNLLESVVDKCNETSTYGCMPVMTITKAEEE